MLKTTKKIKLLNKKLINFILNEKKVMEKLNSTFLANLITTFQDRDNLYLLIQYIPKGNLRQYLKFKKTLTEEETSNF